MKKQFANIKDFVHINLSRGDKSEVLSDDLLNAEKRVDLIKQTCQTTEKKIAACLQTAGIGSDTVSVEKRLKKMPEIHLHQCFNELADQFSSSECDSVMGQTLTECGKLQYLLGKETLAHEMEIERQCLSALNNIIEGDIPSFNKSRKQLNKATSDMDSYKLKHQTAWRQLMQQNQGAYAHTKVEALKKELEDATIKVDQSKDAFATETFALLSREPEFSQVFVQYFRIQADYHRQMCQILEKHLPDLEKVIDNTPKKPVFGTALAEHLRVTGRQISIVIETCIGWLINFLSEEGLFRIPGSASKVRKLKSAFDAGIIDHEEYSYDAHTVAGTLKSYLRELPEPLLTYSLYEDWIEAAKISENETRLTAMWKVINSLPKSNFENLRYFIKFLVKLSQNCDSNKMSSQNLSIAIAPSLIWARPQADSGQFDLNMTAANFHSIIVDSLINYAEWFFPGDIEFACIPLININNERESYGDVSDSINSLTNNHKTQPQVHRPAKKPAPPVPASMNQAVNMNVNVNAKADSGVEENAAFVDTFNAFSSHGEKQQNENTTKVDKQHSPPPSSPPYDSSVIYSTSSLDRKMGKSENANAISNGSNIKVERNHSSDKRQSISYRNKNHIEKPTIPPPSIPNRQPDNHVRPQSVMNERPAIAPPERPTRACDNNNKVMQRSLECLGEVNSGDSKDHDEKSVSGDSSSSPQLYPNLNEFTSLDNLDNEDEAIISIEYVSSDSHDSDARSRDTIAFADDSDDDKLVNDYSHNHRSYQEQPKHKHDIKKPPSKPIRSISPSINSVNSNGNEIKLAENSDHDDQQIINSDSHLSHKKSNDSPSLMRHQNRPPRPQPPANKPRINSSEKTYL